MEQLREALRALAISTKEAITSDDDSKYGPIAQREREFIELVKDHHYEDVVVKDLPDQQYARIEEVDGTLIFVFDTDNISQDVLARNSELFKALHKRLNGFSIIHRRGIAKILSEDDGVVESVFNLFHDRVPRRLLPVLEEALVLREMDKKQSLHKETVFQWRKEIAGSHSERGHDPEEAHNLISLVSIGYLDEGDVFDTMYSQLVEEGTMGKDGYKGLFSKYVNNKPFAEIVQNEGDSVDEILSNLKEKLDQIYRWEGSPGFVDLCGKGNRTHDTIREVRNEIRPGFGGKIKTRHNEDIDKLVIRFEPPVENHVGSS